MKQSIRFDEDTIIVTCSTFCRQASISPFEITQLQVKTNYSTSSLEQHSHFFINLIEVDVNVTIKSVHRR